MDKTDAAQRSRTGLILNPLDVLFFREAKPFGSGDTPSSRLPLPQTLAGMLKTHLMDLANLKPGDLHGLRQDPQHPKRWLADLRFRGPWLYLAEPKAFKKYIELRDSHAGGGKGQADEGWREGPLFPVPADLRDDSGSEGGASASPGMKKWRRLILKNEIPPGWNPPEGCPDLKPLWDDGSPDSKAFEGFWDGQALKNYLQNAPRTGADRIWKLKDLASWEDRTGIGMDPGSGVAAQGQIYSASMLRLHPGIAFYGEIEGVPGGAAPTKGWEGFFPPGLALPWGGEGRRVRVEAVKAWDWGDSLVEEDRFITLLVTPGIFSDQTFPWRPQPRGKLAGAAVPKPLPVSGWDLAGEAVQGKGDGYGPGRPRPTRFAVPAGAIYYWERGNNHEPGKKSAGEPRIESLCDKPQDAAAGWGLALRGKCPKG